MFIQQVRLSEELGFWIEMLLLLKQGAETCSLGLDFTYIFNKWATDQSLLEKQFFLPAFLVLSLIAVELS